MTKRNPICNGCKKCGDKLDGLAGCCCSHVCHAICLTLQPSLDKDCPNTSDCECTDTVHKYVLFDNDSQSFHGTIGCGIEIPFAIYIEYDRDEESCYACLSSPCNSTVGSGVGTGSSVDDICVPMGENNSNCIGNLGTANDLVGGMEFEWELDLSNCGGDECLSSYTLIARCLDRILPEEITEITFGTGCKGCSCLCKDLCITWFYNGPPMETGTGTGSGFTSCSQKRRVSFDEATQSWHAVFDPNDKNRLISDLANNPIDVILNMSQPGECQTELTLSLVTNSETDQCELLISSNLGSGSNTGSSLTEKVLSLSNCPQIDAAIELNEYETLLIECWECGNCDEENCQCECRKVPATLHAEIIAEPEPNVCFSNGQTGGWELTGIYEGVEGCLWWGVGTIDAEEMLIVFQLSPDNYGLLSVYGCPVNALGSGAQLNVPAFPVGSCYPINFAFSISTTGDIYGNGLPNCFADDTDYDPPEPFMCNFKVIVTE
ncbi:hypothetical protein Mal35_02060 [Gimesia maris]|uniref:hypothetical protein n=1 Tax=Gimesia maris TaxID=122 RepID=UPI00118BA03C|nr:hypothetical protein [Gimesia maris]QDT76785.1 hypothetical protein Mal35_02060 [Gimesia maris]